MTLQELDQWLSKNEEFIEYKDITDDNGENSLLIRDLRYPYYSNHPDNFTKVAIKKLEDITVEKLEEEISRGLKVEHITRVTGYFSKVNQWNSGKKAELKDRDRVTI